MRSFFAFMLLLIAGLVRLFNLVFTAVPVAAAGSRQGEILQNTVAPSVGLLVSSGLLVVAAVVFATHNLRTLRGRNHHRYSILICAGFFLGWIGDLCFSQLVLKESMSVVFGALSYGIGHIAYVSAIAGYSMYSHRRGPASLVRDRSWQRCYGAWLAVGLVFWCVTIFQAPAVSLMFSALTFIYCILLSIMVASASFLVLRNSSFRGLFVGAVLFFISDVLCGVVIFNPTAWKFLGRLGHIDLISLTYGPAQVLIVLSLLAIRRTGVAAVALR